MLNVLILAILTSVSPAPHVIGSAAHPATQGDGLVDNAAFQSAVDAAGADGEIVLVPPGLWELGHGDQSLGNPFKQYSVFAYREANPVVIRCAPGAVLRMVGDGLGATWAMLGAEYQIGFHVEGCLLDGSGRTDGYAEHQHLLKVGYGVKHWSARNLMMFHPSLGDSAGGDCLSVLGGYTTEELVEHGVVDRLWGVVCDRSVILLQRSVRHVTVTNSGGFAAGDQIIDSEASDAADPFRWMYDILFDNFLGLGHGGVAAQFGRGARVHVRNSAFLNGTVTFQSCRDCSLDHVTVEGGYTDNPVLYVRRAEERLTVSNSRFTRPADAVLHIPVVQITADAEGAPTDLKFIGNRILQTTTDPGVLIHSGAGTLLLGNTIEYAPTFNGPNAVALVFSTTLASSPAGGVVSSNRITGVWRKVAIVGGGAGQVTFVGNISTGAGIGLECSTGGPVVSVGNNYVSSTGAPVLDTCLLDVPNYP